jgi:hypothetical protein
MSNIKRLQHDQIDGLPSMQMGEAEVWSFCKRAADPDPCQRYFQDDTAVEAIAVAGVGKVALHYPQLPGKLKLFSPSFSPYMVRDDYQGLFAAMVSDTVCAGY